MTKFWMTHCVVLTNTTDVYIHAQVNYIYSAFTIPDNFAWNMTILALPEIWL